MWYDRAKCAGQSALFDLRQQKLAENTNQRPEDLTVAADSDGPLAAAVRAEAGTAYAEPDFFSRVLSPLFGVAFTWDRASRTLAARPVETPEIGVEATVSAFEGTTKVVFRFSQAPAYRTEKGDGQVVLRFPGAKLVPAVSNRLFI